MNSECARGYVVFARTMRVAECRRQTYALPVEADASPPNTRDTGTSPRVDNLQGGNRSKHGIDVEGREQGAGGRGYHAVRKTH